MADAILQTKSFGFCALEMMEKIPKGKVTTYRQIALALKNPNACRAVGNACNKNPFAPKIPCHRVVSSDGSIGGYAFGIRDKIRLLESEGIKIRKGRVVDFEKKLFRF
ncbi:MAG TPA: MGMT family protein [Candidatus Diapherotrites archaeon]|uniref:MGMT family protein n=1 Tax=Candidatus Iainarchaeum sp. TaxID=3101447 RepID=A0A7J4J2M0_9ARCH|nr:MGMT family protein [Candidatus Diapherotrites archaeon]